MYETTLQKNWRRLFRTTGKSKKAIFIILLCVFTYYLDRPVFIDLLWQFAAQYRIPENRAITKL